MAIQHPLLYPLASAAQISQTPSRADGVPDWLEEDLRAEGCRLIQSAGILLGTPQVVMATAQVLFQRFWYVTSMREFSILEVAMGALYLASKLEEHIARMRDIINTFDLLLSRLRYTLSHPSMPLDGFQYTPMSYYSDEYYAYKDELIIGEMQLLKRLAFNVQVQLPYNTMVNYLNVLGLGRIEDIAQMAWSFLNDALQTPVYAVYPFPTIACASIHLAARQARVVLPEPPEHEPWWELFDTDFEDIEQVCVWVLRLYSKQDEKEREEVFRLLLGGRKEVKKWLEDNSAKNDVAMEHLNQH
ncbi:cyclin-L1 [Dacryopinax primogenitus]|uniref:Cyclin-L1 n=1 Tax=Dacryopinax primogenitus (strain DJM 731) TaxID=1858805 RepID=M5G076_DACPD|nr:cyclin-L1 [Dacryopinax primogenitus]EJU02154.1 cyclin-L1 [Dacryopinax primogenitus]